MSETAVVFIKGERVNLRPVAKSDAPFLTVAINRPEVRRFLGNDKPMTEDEELRWVENLATRKSNNIVFIIEVDGKAIGTIGLHRIDWVNRSATTGTMIGDPSYWGKGYATEAKMLLLDYAFNTLNLRKIYSEVLGANEASLAYAAKCGYVEEGCIPNHYFREGKYHDKVILAVYRKPWQKLWRKYQKAHSPKA